MSERFRDWKNGRRRFLPPPMFDRALLVYALICVVAVIWTVVSVVLNQQLTP
jgi:hypothetical protein